MVGGATHTKERVSALSKASSTAGAQFKLTGGMHLTCHDLFEAAEINNNGKEIETIEKKKAEAVQNAKKVDDCLGILGELEERKIDPFTDTGAGKLKIKHLDPLLKWKLGVTTLPMEIRQSIGTRRKKWLEVMSSELPLGTASDENGWSDADEHRVQYLKNVEVTIKDPDLEREKQKHTNECSATISAATPQTKKDSSWMRSVHPRLRPSPT